MKEAAGNIQAPLVTVLLPVYNAEAFLRDTISSILSQTFTDFELLIINDGSTDTSNVIVRSFVDPRIRILENTPNAGLIATLNRGISEARGKYIARIDADDIAKPARLEKQVARMESDPGIAVLASFVEFINVDGAVTGEWSTDREAVSEEDIRQLMMKTNCIAHPSVMMRTDIARSMRYSRRQKGAEDWDLWMRMLASGLRIVKLPEVLLSYRIHPDSISGKDKQELVLERRLMRVKRKFLFGQLAKFRINGFVLGVKISLLKNFTRHMLSNKFPEWARDIKRILTSPPWKVYSEGRVLRKTLAGHKGRHFFVFPYMHVGGAEKVHASIVETVRDQSPLVLFSAFSDNRKFLERFTPHAKVVDVAHYVNYPFTRRKAKRLLAEKINHTPGAVFFGSNSGLFYDLVPFLSPEVKIIDLIHAFKYQPGANLAHRKLLPLATRIDWRIFVSQAAKNEFEEFYFRNNIPKRAKERLHIISNAVPVSSGAVTTIHKPIGVLFVGRNSPEKRLHLFLQVAQTMQKDFPGQFRFTVAGAERSSEEFSFVNFTGEITDEHKIRELYAAHDVLLLTSSREGFPMVIMEAMAAGLAVIATPVGDIPNRLNGENGIVISSAEEDQVVPQIVAQLRRITASEELFLQIKGKAQNYAGENFSEEKFRTSYRALLDVPENG